MQGGPTNEKASLAEAEGHLRPKLPTAEADKTKEPQGKALPPVQAEAAERPIRCYAVYTRSERAGFAVLTLYTVWSSGTTERRTEVEIATDPRLAELLRSDNEEAYGAEFDMMRGYPPTTGSAAQITTADGPAGMEAEEDAGHQRKGRAPREPLMCNRECGRHVVFGGKPGLCKRCGGGKRCKTPGCGKSARSAGTGLCVKCGGGERCKTRDCPNSAQSGGVPGLCRTCMPRCKGTIFGFAGGPSQACALAGLRDKGSGELLCAEHARRGEVTNAEAGALVSKALGRATQLPPGRSRWSLWNSLGAEKDRLGELTDGDKALVIKACEVELRRKCTEPPGNLTRCHVALNGLLTEADLEMLAPPAPVVAEREATRAELDTEALRCGWPVLGHAARGVYPTAALSTMDLNLAEFGPAAAQQLEQQQQRRRPATSLAEVLEELEIRAGELTESNDFTQGFALGDRLKKDVVLIDRPSHLIVLHYDPYSRELNYLQRPASSLRLEERPSDPNSEADLVALLSLIFAQQDYNRDPRSSEVVAGFMIRDDQVVLHESFKMHPELFPAPKPGEPAPTDCTLATYARTNRRRHCARQ